MEAQPPQVHQSFDGRLLSIGLALLGAALPLSLIATEAITFALWAILLLHLVKGNSLRLTVWDLPFFFFFLLRLISGIFGSHPETAQKGLTNLLFSLAYVITAWHLQGADKSVWRNFIRGLVIGTAISSLVAFSQLAGGAERGTGMTGGWTVFGSLTGTALVMGIYQAIRGGLFPRKYQDVASLTLVAAGLAVSICRAEWVAAFLVLLPAAILFHPRFSAVLMAGTIITFLAVTPLRERLLTLTDPLANLSGREVIWQPSIELIREKPILGHGLNSFHAIFPAELRPMLTDAGAGDWHNVYLQVAAESGLLGLAAFLWMLATGLFLGYKGIQEAKTPPEQGIAWGLFAALAFFCIAGGTGVFLVRIPVVVLVFLILGALSNRATRSVA